LLIFVLQSQCDAVNFNDVKVVTYKYLSRSIKVHVNVAKQMLFNFVDEERKKKPSTQLGKKLKK
jgi:DNA polymerase subunit Cdc27